MNTSFPTGEPVWEELECMALLEEVSLRARFEAKTFPVGSFFSLLLDQNVSSQFFLPPGLYYASQTLIL